MQIGAHASKMVQIIWSVWHFYFSPHCSTQLFNSHYQAICIISAYIIKNTAKFSLRSLCFPVISIELCGILLAVYPVKWTGCCFLQANESLTRLPVCRHIQRAYWMRRFYRVAQASKDQMNGLINKKLKIISLHFVGTQGDSSRFSWNGPPKDCVSALCRFPTNRSLL